MAPQRHRSAAPPFAQAFQRCTWLRSHNLVNRLGPRLRSRWSCSLSQPFPQDISDLLVESGYDLDVLNSIGRKLRTPAATCLRVNTLRADVDIVAAELEEHCLASCGFRPSILRHPILKECLILPPRFNPKFHDEKSEDGSSLERVVLSCRSALRQCGCSPHSPNLVEHPHPTTVLARQSISDHTQSYASNQHLTDAQPHEANCCGAQGADVFAPGVAAVPADLREGEAVSVYADITDCVQRGGVIAGQLPKPRFQSPLCSFLLGTPVPRPRNRRITAVSIPPTWARMHAR
eukprot:3360591-Rhodomonas_salina.2